MTTLTGHITQTEKKAIKAILNANLMSGKVGIKTYFLFLNDGIYTVKVQQKDRGMIPVGGSELRVSTYTSTFTA